MTTLRDFSAEQQMSMAAVLPDAVYLVLRASLGRRARSGQHLRHRTRAVVLSVNACMTS